MSIKLENGLINVGGILTETYVRDTRATDEAKQELGLDPNQDYKSSIGIANVEEYVTMSVINMATNDTAIFDLSQFDQALRLVSLYIDNANQDQVIIEVWTKDTINFASSVPRNLLTQRFNRNKTPFQFPDAPLPPNVELRVTAKTPIGYMQLAFKPCVIIASASGRLQGEPNDNGGVSRDNSRA